MDEQIEDVQFSYVYALEALDSMSDDEDVESNATVGNSALQREL